jgi:hypothetical protein
MENLAVSRNKADGFLFPDLGEINGCGTTLGKSKGEGKIFFFLL